MVPSEHKVYRGLLELLTGNIISEKAYVAAIDFVSQFNLRVKTCTIQKARPWNEEGNGLWLYLDNNMLSVFGSGEIVASYNKIFYRYDLENRAWINS